MRLRVLALAAILCATCTKRYQRDPYEKDWHDRLAAEGALPTKEPSRRLLRDHYECVRDTIQTLGPAVEPVPYDSPRDRFLATCMKAKGWMFAVVGWTRQSGGPAEPVDAPWPRPQRPRPSPSAAPAQEGHSPPPVQDTPSRKPVVPVPP